jgi:hypothetical protein
MKTAELPPLTAIEFRILNSASRSGSVAVPFLKESEIAFNAILARGSRVLRGRGQSLSQRQVAHDRDRR